MINLNLILTMYIHLALNFKDITADDIFKCIDDLSTNKSSGLDDIKTSLLKLASPHICSSLSYICNLSLTSSEFPNDWKKAKVTPIYKSGNHCNLENYRPISILSVVSKILEKCVHNQLYYYLTSCNILSNCQSGFRANHSTSTALLDFQDYILNNMDKGIVTGVIFLDLKKAFDTVNHNILLSKLKHYGINGKVLKWFKSYLSQRSQTVSIGSEFSDFKNIDIGVPQGSILGPLLFIIYINSLPEHINCKVVMYADDTSLLLSSKDPKNLEHMLNYNLNNIAKWFSANELTLNIKKTKFMIFGSSHMIKNFKDISVKYNGTILEHVQEFKYLGVTLDSTLSWDCHVNIVNSKISKKIGVIRRVKHLLPQSSLSMLGSALVLPLFDYCSSVWNNCSKLNLASLQTQQNKLARIILGADLYTPIDDMLNDLNWSRLNKRWDIAMYCLIYKCLSNLAPAYLSSQFDYTSSIHSYPTRYQCSASLVLPRNSSRSGQRTFHARAVKMWNTLPPEVRLNFSSVSLSVFKRNVRLFL